MKKLVIAVLVVAIAVSFTSCEIIERIFGIGGTSIQAPTGLTASAGDFVGYIELTWNAVARADHYRVFSSTSATGTYTSLAEDVTGDSAIITYQAEVNPKALTGSDPFFFKVSAVALDGTESDMSSYAEGWAIVLSAPTGVTASDGTYGDQIVISWTAADSAAQYNIYRSTSASGTYTNIGWVDAIYTSTYNSTTEPSSYPITVGTHYFYKVTSQDDDGNESELSDYDEGWAELQGPAAPTVLSASQAAFPSTIQLDWNDVTGATSYHVYTSTTATGTQNYLGEVILSYANIINVSYGVTRYYWVSSEDSLGTEGPKSAVFSGSTFKNGTVNYLDDGSGDYIQFYTNEAGNQGFGFYKTYGASSFTPGDTLATTIIKKSGSATTGQGVVFGYQDSDNYLLVLINTSGSFIVQQKLAGSFSVLNPSTTWDSSSYINTGLDQENVITIQYYYNSGDSQYYFDIYFNSSPSRVFYIYAPSPINGTTGFYSYVSPSSDFFPDTPVDVRFEQTSPALIPTGAASADTASAEVVVGQEFEYPDMEQ